MTDKHPNDPTPDADTDTTADERENFLTRWSRRKSMSRDAGEPLKAAPESVAVQEPAVESGEDTPRAAAAASQGRDVGQSVPAPDATPDLPPIESLDEHSDYSVFLAPDVAADIQRKALRKLFHGPQFHVRDGLDDYDLDYSNPQPLGDVITAEMRRRLLHEVERLARLDTEGNSAEESGVAASEDETGQDGPGTDDDQSDPA